MKYCPKCKKEKPLSSFYVKKNARWKSEEYQPYCKDCVRDRTHIYYLKNREELKERERNRKKKLGEELLASRRLGRKKLRQEVLNQYGGECACCKENRFEFLAIDHIDGGGQSHLKSIGGASNLIYWLRLNKYPKEFQVLCHNCNMAKGMYGFCPHKK